MKTDVLEFKDLVSFHEGKFVKEKTYHLNLNGMLLGSALWCAWLNNKAQWSKWHVRYFFVGEPEIYSNIEDFIKVIDSRTLQVV